MKYFDLRYLSKYINGIKKHDPSLFVLSKNTISNSLIFGSPCQMKILNILNNFVLLGLLPKSAAQSLLSCILVGVEHGEICCFSINSHALSPCSDRLRNKPQYVKNGSIAQSLKLIAETFDIAITYFTILPDIDSEYPLPVFEDLWGKNKSYIEELSNTKVIRLSKIASELWQDISLDLPRLINYKHLLFEIEQFEKSYLLPDFAATNQFARKQIFSYVVTGLALERLFPWAILFDVQKKRYPFEQPYYNFGRNRILPIIYCGQDVL